MRRGSRACRAQLTVAVLRIDLWSGQRRRELTIHLDWDPRVRGRDRSDLRGQMQIAVHGRTRSGRDARI